MALASTLRLAWRNLGRNRRRTALALSAIAIAEAVVVFYEALLFGYGDVLIESVTASLVGHVQVHAPRWREDRALDRVVPDAGGTLAALRARPGVKQASARVYAPVLVAKGEDAQAGLVVGLDPDAERVAGLLRGVPAPPRLAKGEALLGDVFAQTVGAQVGDEVALVGQAADGSLASGLWRVAGVVSTEVDFVNQGGVLLGLDDARELLVLPDAAHELVVMGADPAQAGALAVSLGAAPELAGLEVLGWRQVSPEFAQIVDVIWAYEYVLLLVVFVAAAAGAANTMMMATFERLHEFGMLLALGTRPRRVVGLVLAESVLLGLLGAALGAALAVALVTWLGHVGLNLSVLAGEGPEAISWGGLRSSLVIYPRMLWSGLGRGLGAVALTTLVAALWPALKAARLEPMEAMRA